MNVAYASSETYYEPTLVSIYSLLKNSVERHHVIVLSSGLSAEKVSEIKKLVVEMGSTFESFDVTQQLARWANEFSLPLMRGSYSTYTRIFLAEILSHINSVLLIDSDTLVIGDVSELDQKFNGKLLMACRDYVVANVNSMHEDMNLRESIYFNVGVVLINLKKWRADCITDKLRKEYVVGVPLKIADQTIINRYLGKFIGELDLRYNYYTYFHYPFSYEFYRKLNNHTPFVSPAEFSSARAKPIIIHFIGTWYERPWFSRGISPFNRIYYRYWNACFPGRDLMAPPSRDARSYIYDQISIFLFRHIGVSSYFSFKYKIVQVIKKLGFLRGWLF